MHFLMNCYSSRIILGYLSTRIKEDLIFGFGMNLVLLILVLNYYRKTSILVNASSEKLIY